MYGLLINHDVDGNYKLISPGCQPVGVADSIKIPNAQMTASSYYSSSYYPYYGRLNEARGSGGWCPRTRQGPRTDYLQVDLATIQSVCAVATQGTKASEWTTSYVLRMSIDGIIWNPYKENNAEKVRQRIMNTYRFIFILFTPCSLDANWLERENIHALNHVFIK